MRKQIFILALASLITMPAMAKRQRRVSAAPVEQVVKLDEQKVSRSEEKAEVQTEEVAQTEANKTTKMDAHPLNNIWHKGANTVVQLKGQATEDSALCKTFNVKLADRLEFKIECMGKEIADSLDLETNGGKTVTQKGEHLTITQYGYMTKKPRIAKAKSSTLKVPFVERIIHIKKMPEGEMAFYLESFREDEFGRIVQDGFIQAHSLTNEKLKISAN